MKFLLMLIPLATQAAETMETYAYVYSGKTIQVRVGEAKGIKVNDKCLENQQSCAALATFQGPSKLGKLKGAKQGNAAGAYCELLGGTQLFAHKGESPNVQFCVFKDLTFIDAKALYKKHLKAKK